MKNNLVLRLITAVVAASVVIPAIIFSPYGLWVFSAVVSLLGLWEFIGVVGAARGSYRVATVALAGLAWLLALADLSGLMSVPSASYGLLAVLSLPILGLLALYDRSLTQPVAQLGSLVLGVVYCYLPLWLFYHLGLGGAEASYDYTLPLGILLLTWVLDVMAYFSGRFLGRRPLFPRISPKKTWEGAIGGALFCLAAGWGLQLLWAPDGFHWLVIAGIISVVSQWGDLVESMFKRSLQVKDSGSLLPGHGGMLDRFDGLFYSVPVIFSYLSLL
ncbi:MAG: hypothetical protein D6722_07880 [Bacteroidetes bacterium]|nr:MAG: hypothetical protein D6722_07880 [Bacteroidota bacterium]